MNTRACNHFVLSLRRLSSITINHFFFLLPLLLLDTPFDLPKRPPIRRPLKTFELSTRLDISCNTSAGKLRQGCTHVNHSLACL